MKLKSMLVVVGGALALAVSVAPASASTVSYDWTAAGGHAGSFVFDDTATSVGNGPFGQGGVAYDALSFVIDGALQTDPLLIIYQNFGGNQYAFFTAGAGYPYVQLSVTGTGLFNSSAASEMAQRQLGDFSSAVLYAFGSALQVTTMVPEPGTFVLLSLGLAGLGFARRRKTT
jgi:hypothetical protein